MRRCAMVDLPRIGSDTHGNPNAMISWCGDLFHPDSPEDAAQFAADHAAWFVTPDQATMCTRTAEILGQALGDTP